MVVLFVFFFFFVLFRTRFLSVTVLAILELALTDQAALEFRDPHASASPSAAIKGLHSHHLVVVVLNASGGCLDTMKKRSGSGLKKPNCLLNSWF